jgi:hypothetical protein
MPTDEIIIRLFCMVDEQLGPVNKRLDAHLCPSEIVTIGLLFVLKGGHFRAFESLLNKNYCAWFPHLPERTHLQRLLRDCAEQAFAFLADPTFFTVADTYGIELIHPRRERRSKQQIGKKGKSNGRWIVGIKLAWLINEAGEVVDWTWSTPNEPDNVFYPLATGYDGKTIALADQSFREKDAQHRISSAVRGAPGTSVLPSKPT